MAQAQGVIGSGQGGPREVEAAPALSVTLGCFPGTELRTIRVDDGNLPDGGSGRGRTTSAKHCQPLEAKPCFGKLLVVCTGQMPVWSAACS